MKCRRAILVSVSVAILALVLAGVLGRNRIWAIWQIHQAEYLAQKGDSGWGGEVGQIVKQLQQQVNNQNWLARRLIHSRDGSLRAEGMILLVRIDDPEARSLITPFLQDKAWNYFMLNNDEVAKQAMEMLDLKHGSGAPGDQEKIHQWETLGS